MKYGMKILFKMMFKFDLKLAFWIELRSTNE